MQQKLWQVDKVSHSRYLFEGAIEEEQCVCQITKDYTRGFGLLLAGKERRVTVQSTLCAEMVLRTLQMLTFNGSRT